MASISSFQPGVVLHSKRRLDQSILSAIRKAYPEGVDTPGLKKYLKQGLYNPVLCAVWGERNLQRRVDWLRANADLHAPLMFELAIAEFEIEPTIQKVIHVSMPLINAATFRAHQDMSCLESDLERDEFDEEMYRTYTRALRFEMEQYYPNISLNKLMLKNEDVIKNCTIRRLNEIAKRALDKPETLPSPLWIGYDLQGKLYPMKPLDEIHLIRKSYEVFG